MVSPAHAQPQPEAPAGLVALPATEASTRSRTRSTRASKGDQLKNRLLLKNGLEKQGFVNYDNEWWHYTYKPEPFPDTYFDLPIDRSSLE